MAQDESTLYISLFQFFALAPSVIGVFLVFRLQLIEGRLSAAFAQLDRAVKAHNRFLERYGPREKIRVLFDWLWNREDPLRSAMSPGCADFREPLGEIFTLLEDRHRMVMVFQAMIWFASLLAMVFLGAAWKPTKCTSVFALLSILMVPGFTSWACSDLSEWAHWGFRKSQWTKLSACDFNPPPDSQRNPPTHKE